MWQLGKGGGGVTKYAGSRDELVHLWSCQFDWKYFVEGCLFMNSLNHLNYSVFTFIYMNFEFLYLYSPNMGT